MKIDGREIAQKILEELRIKVSHLEKAPHLAIILIGDDPASKSYVNQKELKAKIIGAKTTVYKIPISTSANRILRLLNDLNHLTFIHGIIVQQPLPPHINIKRITEAINPNKDVDGFHSESKFQPPIAQAVLEILKPYSFKTKKIVVIGKGETGGKPVIEALKKMNINPDIIDSKTMDHEPLTKKADIIISAVGKSNVIKPNMIKKGVILISIGLHKDLDGKLQGDYEEEQIKNIAAFYTPSPGGVGPINVAMLLKNLVAAVKERV